MANRSVGRDADLAVPKSERRRWWPIGRRRQSERPSRTERKAESRRMQDNDASERSTESKDRVGRLMESFARGMGTPAFLIVLTVFVIVWMVWNAMAPETLRFDSADLGFTALTLMLSLQASYAAPMLLLAQNRQDDRDRVQIEQDRQRAERNTADLEYLAREIVALRLLVTDMASKDFIRAELRGLLEDLEEIEEDEEVDTDTAPTKTTTRRARGAEGDDYRERDMGEQRRRARVRREIEAEEQAKAHDD